MASTQVQPGQSRLFKPLQVGTMPLQHRVVLAPLTRLRNTDDHTPQDMMAKYYGDRASVPGTLLISEATAINALEEGQRNTPGFSSDAQFAAWQRVIAAVHARGSFFFQQIWGIGRAAQADFLAEKNIPYRSSSAVPMSADDATPLAMTEEEIQHTIDSFVATAKRVIAAGADGVEIHGAHGYLLDQFLSDKVNQRTDRWGGSIENRARLTLEVVRAVVAAIGAERVAIRFSPFAGFQGAEKEDAHELFTYIIGELKSMKVQFAYLSLVEAVGDPGSMIFGAKEINQDRTLDFILEAWDNLSPVLVAGGYQPESATRAVEERYQKWDVMVAFGRHFLANPDLVYRIQNGIALNKYNRPTFYINKSEVGYNDYPFSEEFLAQQAANVMVATSAEQESYAAAVRRGSEAVKMVKTVA